MYFDFQAFFVTFAVVAVILAVIGLLAGLLVSWGLNRRSLRRTGQPLPSNTRLLICVGATVLPFILPLLLFL